MKITMKKDIRYIILHVALVSISLVGCARFEEDVFFNENASLRITQFNEQLQSRLVAKSQGENNGWVIQYFVSGTDEHDFEGFNLLGNFSQNGMVTLAGNHRYLRNGQSGKYTEFKSTYELLREEGPVLAFNTWNDILTVFVDPVDPQDAPAALNKDGEGMGGDQNLVFRGYEGNNILFRGQRHSANIRFVPCDRPWEKYFADTETLRNFITNNIVTSYYVICGTDTLYFKDLRSGIVTYCERVNEPQFPSKINCVFSPTGFYLQHRNHIKGTSFQEFFLTDDKTRLISENDSVQVIPTWDYYINDCPSMWRIKEECFTPEQQELYTKMAAEVVKANSKNVLDSIVIGRMPHTVDKVTTYYPALILCAHRPRKPKDVTIRAYVNLGIYRPQYGLLKLEAWQKDAPVSQDMESFAATELKSLCEQFAASVLGTYRMVPNDYFRPTYVSLVPVDGGNTLQLNLKKIVD